MSRRAFIGRFVRFGLVGGTTALFSMGLNALLGKAAGLSPNAAFLTAYPPTLALHFTLNKLWTFRDRTATSHRHILRYLVSVAITFAVQWPLFTAFQRGLGFPGWLATGVAAVLQMGLSYALLARRVFNRSHPPAPEVSPKPGVSG